MPTYYFHSRICFIWPSLVPWGNVTTSAVRLGFGNGNMMRDEIYYLNKGNRKQVYWKDFSQIMEIDIDILKSYIYEAARIDAELNRKKSKQY